MKVDKLLDKGISSEIIQSWKNFGYESLLPVQEEAIETGALDGKSLLVCAPTSSGKTFIGEMVAVAYALSGKRTLYLVPFKTIAEEKYAEFTEKYGKSDIGLLVRISDRDRRETDDEIRIGHYDIAILTYEKLSALLVTNPGILDTCNCVIVDEIQMIMDPERGGNLELLLTKIKATRNNTQIIGLSAVLKDLNGFDKWLGAEVIFHRERPVELYQGVLRPDGIYEYRTWNTQNTGEEQFKSSTLFDLIKELLSNDEQVIIIRNSVPQSIQTAIDLARVLSSLPAASTTIARLNEEAETETREELLKTLRHSIAFHNADCELGERLAVEQGFRTGEIRVLAATTTLSTGVNLPCKTIILADNFKWSMVRGNLQRVNWLVGEVHNIFGRAGRLGQKDGFGRGILIANDQREYRSIQGAYLNAQLEELESTFANRDIGLRVLDVVATGFAGRRKDISDFIFLTFAAKEWKTPEAKRQIKDHIQNGIERCISGGLFKEAKSGLIQATSLGRICAAKQVAIETFKKLTEYVKEAEAIDILDLVFVAASTDEVCKPYYRGVNWNELNLKKRLLQRLNELSAKNELKGSLAQFYSHQTSYLSTENTIAITSALLTKDILESNLTNREIGKKHNLTSANIRKMCLNLSWVLDTLSGIAKVVRPKLAQELQYISECVNNRTPISCRFLNRIHSVNLTRDEKIELAKAGYLSEDDFLDKKGSDFRGVINPSKANKIIEHINNKRTRNQEFWQRDHKRRLDSIGVDTSRLEAIYTESGIVLERSICELFQLNFAACNVNRITDQREGEPDLLLTFPSGERVTVQVTAKKDQTSFIDSKKAGDVISQSARFHPDGFICLGRPDFQDLAREQANHHALDKNFKLLPMYVLAELFVRVKEGKIDTNLAAEFLLNARGYLTVSEIDNMATSS